jgi:hypothetical protein
MWSCQVQGLGETQASASTIVNGSRKVRQPSPRATFPFLQGPSSLVPPPLSSPLGWGPGAVVAGPPLWRRRRGPVVPGWLGCAAVSGRLVCPALPSRSFITRRPRQDSNLRRTV